MENLLPDYSSFTLNFSGWEEITISPLQIANTVLFLLITCYAIYLFIKLVRTRIAYIKLGKKAEFNKTVNERIEAIIVNVLGQKKLLKDKKSGTMHVMYFYGFLLVQFGAIDLIWRGIGFDSHLPLGPLYPYFSFFQEIIVLMILVATIWGFYRRYIEKLVRLKRSFVSGLVYMFLGGLMIATLFANGMGIIWHGEELSWSEPIASLIAYSFSWLPQNCGCSPFPCFLVVASIMFTRLFSLHSTRKNTHT